MHFFVIINNLFNTSILGISETIVQFTKRSQLVELCKNLEKIYLCSILPELSDQTVTNKFIKVCCKILKTDNINSYLKSSPEDQMKVIRETVDFDKSLESNTFHFIENHIHNIIPYHNLREFKPRYTKPVKKRPSTKPSESTKSTDIPGPSRAAYLGGTFSAVDNEMIIEDTPPAKMLSHQ